MEMTFKRWKKFDAPKLHEIEIMSMCKKSELKKQADNAQTRSHNLMHPHYIRIKKSNL